MPLVVVSDHNLLVIYATKLIQHSYVQVLTDTQKKRQRS